MATNTPTKPRIVGYGAGHRVYGSELVTAFFDGATVTITLGNLEARIDRLDDTPTGPPDLMISGQITLTPGAAIKVAQTINNIMGAIAAQNQKPQGPAN